jgi:hypothetical protein
MSAFDPFRTLAALEKGPRQFGQSRGPSQEGCPGGKPRNKAGLAGCAALEIGDAPMLTAELSVGPFKICPLRSRGSR